MTVRTRLAAIIPCFLTLPLICLVASAQEINTALMNSTFEIIGNGPQIGQIVSGTGFIMGIPEKENPDVGHTVLITAAHVLNGLSGNDAKILLRRPDGQGGYTQYPYPLPIRANGKNLYVANPNADVAAMYILLPQELGITDLPIQFLADDARLAQLQVHPGDELFCLGFPLGIDFNGFPILRTGTLASYPITPAKAVKRYLFTFHIFPGNSGGPVYFYFSNRVYGGSTHTGTESGVIGLVSEQINSTSPEYKNNGLDVAVVVPSTYIRETISQLPAIP